MDTRSRFIADGDLLLMGIVYHDHAIDRGTLHKLHAPAEESGGSTRDRHFDFRWWVGYIRFYDTTNIQ